MLLQHFKKSKKSRKQLIPHPATSRPTLGRAISSSAKALPVASDACSPSPSALTVPCSGTVCHCPGAVHSGRKRAVHLACGLLESSQNPTLSFSSRALVHTVLVIRLGTSGAAAASMRSRDRRPASAARPPPSAAAPPGGAASSVAGAVGAAADLSVVPVRFSGRLSSASVPTISGSWVRLSLPRIGGRQWRHQT